MGECTIHEKVEIVDGNYADWRGMAGFHYRGERLGVVDRVYVMRWKGKEEKPPMNEDGRRWEPSAGIYGGAGGSLPLEQKNRGAEERRRKVSRRVAEGAEKMDPCLPGCVVIIRTSG